MATQVITRLVDDIDESQEAGGTYKFAYDGVHYEIDLSDAHKAEMDRALSKYVKAARRKGGRQIPGANKAEQERLTKTQRVREWAAGEGLEVNPTGRVPKAIMDQYEKAHAA